MFHFDYHLTHFLTRKFEAWVAAGQRKGMIPGPDGKSCQLLYGGRYRLQTVFILVVFGFFSAAFCWGHFTGMIAGAGADIEFWLPVLYFGFVIPVFVLSLLLAIGTWTTRVILSHNGLVFRRFGREAKRFEWPEVNEVYRSLVTPIIVFVTQGGRRIRVSTQLDGVAALAECLAFLQFLAPGTVHQSAVEWATRLALHPDGER